MIPLVEGAHGLQFEVLNYLWPKFQEADRKWLNWQLYGGDEWFTMCEGIEIAANDGIFIPESLIAAVEQQALLFEECEDEDGSYSIIGMDAVQKIRTSNERLKATNKDSN